MTIRQLIAYLLQDNDLDDEILVAYWDKTYFVDELDITEPDKIDTVWKEFIKEGQETVNSHLEFTQTGHNLASDLKEMINEKGNK